MYDVKMNNKLYKKKKKKNNGTEQGPLRLNTNIPIAHYNIDSSFHLYYIFTVSQPSLLQTLATSDSSPLQTAILTTTFMFSFLIDLINSEDSLLQTNVGHPATFEVARVDCM